MPKVVSKKDTENIVGLRDTDGLSFKQIGKKLNLSSDTVSKYYREYKAKHAPPPTPSDETRKTAKENDIEKHPEIVKLKKELRKEEIKKKIEEVRGQIGMKEVLEELTDQFIWLRNEILWGTVDGDHYRFEVSCPNCLHGLLEYHEEKSRDGGEQYWMCNSCRFKLELVELGTIRR